MACISNYLTSRPARAASQLQPPRATSSHLKQPSTTSINLKPLQANSSYLKHPPTTSITVRTAMNTPRVTSQRVETEAGVVNRHRDGSGAHPSRGPQPSSFRPRDCFPPAWPLNFSGRAPALLGRDQAPLDQANPTCPKFCKCLPAAAKTAGTCSPKVIRPRWTRISRQNELIRSLSVDITCSQQKCCEYTSKLDSAPGNLQMAFGRWLAPDRGAV